MGSSRASAPKHPPNTRLTWQRLQRGWSREELVEQIKRSMKQCDEAGPGLNADVVRRWETGDRKPEPRYRKHLVLVFGMPADELGLLSAEESAMCPTLRPGPNAAADMPMSEQLVDVVVEKVILVLLGEKPEFGRHVFLKGLLGVSLGALLSNGLAIPDGVDALAKEQRTRLDPRSIEAYSAITASHRELYWSTPALDLLQSVAAHVQLGASMLKAMSGADGPLPRRLATAVSESSLLASRLNFFDLNRVDAAAPFFQLAEDAAAASQDHALAVAVLAHRAFVPGFAGQQQPARDFLKAAHAHARYGAGPLLRSWLHCVDAEVSAHTGQPEASLARVRSAEDALTTAGIDPVWLDYFDASRLDGFAGNALLLAGQNRDAVCRLEQAVDGLSETAGKQKAVLLFDLAAAQAPLDADRALATAQQACDVVGRTQYATALQRVPELRAALSAARHVELLDERVRALTGVGEKA
jgi:transcriptional regulator with XRE-family HTH domain